MADFKFFKNTDDTLKLTYPPSTDLNGDTLFLTFKRKKGGSEDDSDAALKTNVTINTSTNEATFTLTKTLLNIPVRVYVADVKRVTSGGSVKGMDSYTVEIAQTVTQRSS